jgi:hypothetical protein
MVGVHIGVLMYKSKFTSILGLFIKYLYRFTYSLFIYFVINELYCLYIQSILKNVKDLLII